jgi:hypothetical protein
MLGYYFLSLLKFGLKKKGINYSMESLIKVISKALLVKIAWGKDIEIDYPMNFTPELDAIMEILKIKRPFICYHVDIF